MTNGREDAMMMLNVHMTPWWDEWREDDDSLLLDDDQSFRDGAMPVVLLVWWRALIGHPAGRSPRWSISSPHGTGSLPSTRRGLARQGQSGRRRGRRGWRPCRHSPASPPLPQDAPGGNWLRHTPVDQTGRKNINGHINNANDYNQLKLLTS